MAKKLAILFGVVFVLVGVLGFIPNPIVGASGIFETNTMHDLVHLALGIVLLGVGMLAEKKSALALKAVGIIYLLVALLGFLIAPDGGSLAGLITLNMADHILHVVLGVVLLGAGFLVKDKAMLAPMAAAMPPVAPPSPPTTPL